MRALTDPSTGLPRVGINRTGSRVDRVVIDNEGAGYTQQPTVLLDPPPGGVQALASAVVSEGRIRSVIIDNQGDGYTTAPGVTITEEMVKAQPQPHSLTLLTLNLTLTVLSELLRRSFLTRREF